MKTQSTTTKDDLHRRLRRIEGQTRGVQRMLTEDRACGEIVQQLKAIRSALNNATNLYVRMYAKECLLQAHELTKADQMILVDDVLKLMAKVE